MPSREAEAAGLSSFRALHHNCRYVCGVFRCPSPDVHAERRISLSQGERYIEPYTSLGLSCDASVRVLQGLQDLFYASAPPEKRLLAHWMLRLQLHVVGPRGDHRGSARLMSKLPAPRASSRFISMKGRRTLRRGS